MSEELDFYARPGVMTGIAGFDEALIGMPADPAGIAAVVQGLVVHVFWADAYGVEGNRQRGRMRSKCGRHRE